MSDKVKKMLKIELGILILVLIIFIAILTNVISNFPLCIINQRFGILCPSCGGTRCVVNLVLGNYAQSFLFHPIFFITIIYLGIANIIYIINSFREKPILEWIYPKSKFWIIFIIIVLIFTIIRNII